MSSSLFARAPRDLLVAVADAALKATTDAANQLAGSVEHPQSCAIWVELDDVDAALHPIGSCDCGLYDLDRALDALRLAVA